MSDIKLSSFYSDAGINYHSRTDMLMFLLMPFVFFLLLGFPGKYGGYISTYSSFAVQAFFILFGFFNLVPDESIRIRKLKRAIWRTSKLFGIMLLIFIILDIIYLAFTHSLSLLFSEELLRKRVLFNFFALNVWPFPVGNSIWFVQSLIYAYLFFLLAEKFKLQKFYLPILIILIVFMLATGEFAAFFGFPIFGYPFLPAGAVTRAIPYMLIGMYLRKHVDKLTKIPQFVYPLVFIGGLMAAIGEIELLRRMGKLVYSGHMIGFCFMALSLCCFALAKPKVHNNFFSAHGRSFSIRMYVLCQPVSFLLWLGIALVNPGLIGFVMSYRGIISLLISFLIAFLFGMIKFELALMRSKY